MKMTKALTLILAVGSLLTLAIPADAQMRGNRHGSGNGNRGNFHHGNGRFHNGGRVNVFFGGFGYPFFYGYPYGYYPYYYGYNPYGYGYPGGAYYSYDPRGIYEGRLANPPRSTNDGGGKDFSMAARVQRQLAAAGYYRGEIDGIVGEGTRRAIRSYERANGLPVDGRIDDDLLNAMGLG